MKKMKKLNLLGILAFYLFLFQDCATIMGGKNNTLVFRDGSLPQAKVYIDGEYIGDAPGKIKLPREKIQHGSILEVSAEGYVKKEYLILRKQHHFYSLVDILIGGVPLAVDYATGNIYRPVPHTFLYKLDKNH